MPRNPILFDVFHRMNLIEKVGSGIKRIKKQIKESGLNVKFETNEFFRVVFYRPSERKRETSFERLGENQRRIMELISHDEFVSIVEIAKKLELSTTAIEKNIEKLKNKGFLVII